MSTKTEGLSPAQGAVIRAYQEKIRAQVQEVKARLELASATARQGKANAELATIDGLQAAWRGIEARVEDLKVTHEPNMSRAKAEIETDVAKFRTSVDALAAKLKVRATK